MPSNNNKIAVIVLGIITIISLGFILHLYTLDGGQAFVYQNGDLLVELDLKNNQIYEVKDDQNNVTNIISVEDGYVYMKEANCPDHICMNMGKIKHHNQSIVCLPNKIVINIQDDTNSSYDSIVQ